jgi:hypothetical protein
MVMDETPEGIAGDGPRAEAARALLARKIKWLARQFNSAGTHLGYRYVDSPIVIPDGTPEPPDDPSQIVPSTWPGSRAPHAWLDDGRSMLDIFGAGFVLLQLGRADPDDARLRDAATVLRLPLETVCLQEPELRTLYARRLVLVRPDGHVAWRGEQLPADAQELLDQVRGARLK